MAVTSFSIESVGPALAAQSSKYSPSEWIALWAFVVFMIVVVVGTTLWLQLPGKKINKVTPPIRGSMQQDIILTLIIASIGFGVLTGFGLRYRVMDIPQPYGVPFAFYEKGCSFAAQPSCVNRWHPLALFYDLAIIAVPAYGIIRIVRRRKRKPSSLPTDPGRSVPA